MIKKRLWIGKPVEVLSTPAIIADAQAVETNIDFLAAYFDSRKCKLRPHFKSHKCVTLAKKQLAGKKAVGITCAKVSEAEQLVGGGVRDVLIANQVIGREKVKRIAALNRQATVRVTVDSKEGIRQLGIAAQEAGVKIGVLVEIDIGMNRGGVLPGMPVLDLADMISKTPGLKFDGLQSYEGHLVTLENYNDRKRLVLAAMEPVLETKKILQKKGHDIFVSSGGTGTYDITGNIDGIDELQCGSYVLMDTVYKKVRPEFLFARYILSTVISVRGRTITTDVGIKGMGMEYGMPAIMGKPDAKVLYVAEEHTVIENVEAKIGDNIRLIPPHGCTTNNLYSRMWITRDDIIEDVWEIEGQGCLE